MTKWEYFYESFDRYYLKRMYELGEAGWELVALDFDSRKGIFKRPKCCEGETVAIQGKPCDCLDSEDVREIIDDGCTTVAGCPCAT